MTQAARITVSRSRTAWSARGFGFFLDADERLYLLAAQITHAQHVCTEKLLSLGSGRSGMSSAVENLCGLSST